MLERSDDPTGDKSAILRRKNRFIMFQHLLDDIKKTVSTAAIVSKIIKYCSFLLSSHRELPTIIDYDFIGIIVFDRNMKIPQGLDLQNDSHCKFHKIKCLDNWVDLIYDKKGYSEPAFNSFAKVRLGFRTYEELFLKI